MNVKFRLVLVAISMIALTGSGAYGRALLANTSGQAEHLGWRDVERGVVAATVTANRIDSQEGLTGAKGHGGSQEGGVTSNHGDSHEEGLSRQTQRELARARRATARYHDISRAIADGYADINVFIPHMGFHYLKSTILDAQFDEERPELLVYAQDLCEGRMRLVAVEYAVPINLSPNGPPEGFSGNADEWHRNEQFGLWTLHAWIWFRNPQGVFTELNQRVP